jgi:phytoene synthase
MPAPSFTRLHSTPADCAGCRQAIRQGSKSFHLASLLLPVAIREPAYAVYAFCRMADDRIDREGGGLAAVEEMARLLDRAYGGRPGANTVERAFADVVAAYAIPRAIPDALLEGLAWDARGRRYQTLDELRAYGMRVAGSVGVMMTLIMDRRQPAVLARACDLGVAMQLTNICRDIGEDAAAGRLYLPLDRLAAHGVDPERLLRQPGYSPGVRAVAMELLDEAERLYERALAGIAALPRSGRIGIAAARLLYREIGRGVAGGIDPVAQRSVVSRARKLALVAEAIGQAYPSASASAWPALPEARFMIQAVMASPPPARSLPMPPWWHVEARASRMLELLHSFQRAPSRPDALREASGGKP